MVRTRLLNEALNLSTCGNLASTDLEGCTIKGAIEAGPKPGAWTKIRDCRLKNCAQVHVSIATVALEGVSVDGMRRAGRSPLYLWGCAFREVTLSGKLHGLKMNVETAVHNRRDPTLQAGWTNALENYYNSDTWALDIREAHFTSVPTFEAIPGERVRIDPKRQARVRRSALNGFDVRSLPMAIALDWFLRRSPFDSVVLASSSEPSRRQRDLDNLAKLRDLGIAELQ